MLIEALAVAVSQSVFSYLLSESGLGEKARALLGRDPQRLAFQVAFVKTYATFARNHPQWKRDLFDEHFLQGPAVPLLAGCLQRDGAPPPVELAVAWANQMGHTGAVRERHIEEVLPAATDFLEWLDAELRRRPEFRAFLDSQAFESIAEATEHTAAAMDGLRADLRQAMAHASTYDIAIAEAQHVVVGDYATVTTVWQTFFDSGYATLREFYRPGEEVFERVALGDFVGRGWLESDLDDFLRSNDRGAWLLVGEAGIGKTTFLAHLVRERGYLHFFPEQALGDANPRRALESVAAQLISRFRLAPYAARNTLPQALSGSPDFLATLLSAAAEKLGASERLVLVLDALDEVGVVPGQNVLSLPVRLPRGVYLVLSQRDQAVPLIIKPPPRCVDLRADEVNNQRDIAAYLRRVAMAPGIADQLRAQGYAVEAFVHVLSEKSAGNWMYLHYVVEEIRRGLRAPLDLAALPRGLVGYYAEYWRRWHARPDWERWDTLYAPILTTLAATFEPLPLATLRRWAGVQATESTVRHLLRDEWGGFVYELKGREERQYRLRHASLREFLSGEIEAEQLEQFPPGVEILVEDLGERTRNAHARIAKDLRERGGDHWSKRPIDPYAQRHLSAHLRRAGEYDALFALVDGREWYEVQTTSDPSGGAYLSDVGQAWIAAETADKEAVEDGQMPPLLGREVRCALTAASLHSVSHNIPPELLTAVLTTGLWTASQALSAARQNPSEEARSAALCSLAPHLPPSLLDEALAAARAIRSEPSRARVLVALAAQLPETLMPDALAAARAIRSERSRARVLVALAAQLPVGDRAALLEKALAPAREIRSEPSRAPVLSALAPQLVSLPASTLHSLWSLILHELSSRTRPDALSGVTTMSPVIQALGGKDALIATVRAVAEVGRWFP